MQDYLYDGTFEGFLTCVNRKSVGLGERVDLGGRRIE